MIKISTVDTELMCRVEGKKKIVLWKKYSRKKITLSRAAVLAIVEAIDSTFDEEMRRFELNLRGYHVWFLSQFTQSSQLVQLVFYDDMFKTVLECTITQRGGLRHALGKIIEKRK